MATDRYREDIHQVEFDQVHGRDPDEEWMHREMRMDESYAPRLGTYTPASVLELEDEAA